VVAASSSAGSGRHLVVAASSSVGFTQSFAEEAEVIM
jgi:hypothetical protein